MPVLVIFTSVLAAVCLGQFVLRMQSQHPLRSELRREHFVGSGTWCRTDGASGRTSWPLVRLDIVPWGIVVGPTSRWLQWAVPQVRLRWAEIASVESRPTGVRFNLTDADDRALLFQLHRDAVLAALRPYPIELRA